MRVVIHAGLPKTATSFLQEKVFPHLSADECVFNPEGLNRILIELSKQVQSGNNIEIDDVSRIKKDVDEELTRIDAPVLLLSVEGLMPLHVGGYENTKKILGVTAELLIARISAAFGCREPKASVGPEYALRERLARAIAVKHCNACLERDKPWRFLTSRTIIAAR